MVNLLTAIRSGHPGSLIAAFLYFDISFMVWVLLGGLGVVIAQDLHLSATQKGFMVALPLLSGAIFRVVAGLLADRLGPKRVGTGCLVLVMVPLLWGWVAAESYSAILLVGLLLGVAGASFAVAFPLVSRWYPPEYQGIALGITGAANSGTLLTVLLAPRLAEFVGWHGVFGLALVPVVLTLVVMVLLAREVPDLPKPAPLRGAIWLLHEPDLWWFAFFYSLTFGGFVGLSSLLVIFFHDQYGVNQVMAGNLAALCVLGGSGFRPVGGYLSDRIGGLRLLPWLYVLAAAGLVLVGGVPSLWVTVATLIGVTVVLGMGNGAIFQMVPQRFREDIGFASGLIGAAGGVGGFLLPSLVGWLKDATGSQGTGFLVFAGFVTCGWLALLIHSARWRVAWSPRVVEAMREGQAGRVRMEVVFGG